MTSPAGPPQPSALAVAAWAAGAAIGATLVGILVAPHVGRAGAALVGAVVIVLVGAVRGLPAALLAAVIEFFGFSYFVGERRLPADFDPGRHVPQFLLFLLVALISGWLATAQRRRGDEADRLRARMAALAQAAELVAQAAAPAEIASAIRAIAPQQGFRLFLVTPGGLVEAAPPRLDDAGRAAEAVEVAWLAGHRTHRSGDIRIVALSPTAPAGFLVASRSGGAGADPDFLAALAGLIGLALARAPMPGAPQTP